MGPDQNFGQLFTGIAQYEIFGYDEADPLQGNSDVALFLKGFVQKNALCSQSGHCGYFWLLPVRISSFPLETSSVSTSTLVLQDINNMLLGL